MAKKQEKSGKGNKKIGRWKKKPSNKAYALGLRRAKNKARRVLRSSGVDAALAYGLRNSVANYITRIIEKLP